MARQGRNGSRQFKTAVKKAGQKGHFSKPAEEQIVEHEEPKVNTPTFDSKALRAEGKFRRALDRCQRSEAERNIGRIVNRVDGQPPSKYMTRMEEIALEANQHIHECKVSVHGHDHDHHSPINRKYSEAELTQRDFWAAKEPDHPSKPLGIKPLSQNSKKVIEQKQRVAAEHTRC